jgi:putative FmdB family regulatory protein
MPTYGYECKSCGHTFDVFQSMSEDPVKVCPECGKEVRRLINGGTGIIFKGSGFYVTDKGKGSVGASKSSAKPPAAGTSGETPADKPSGSGSGGASGSPAGTSGEASGKPSEASRGTSGEASHGDKPKASEAKQPAKT